MTTSTSIRSSLISLALAALLTACGGGDDGTEGAVKFAGQMRAASVAAPTVAAAAATTVTADMTLDWAEYKFPELFPKAIALRFPNIEYGGVVYNARAYPGAWGMRYLGITPDGRIYGLGDFTGNALQQFNDIPYWAAQVLADRCSVYPGSCGGPVAGPLNECTDPVAEALPTGFRTRLVYVHSGTLMGEQTTESVIDGPSTFEGQSAIKITSTTSGTGTFEGETVDMSTRVEAYQQLGADGVTKTLGALVQMTIGGFPFSSSKTVYAPPRENLEFHIAEKATGTITSSATTTTLVPPGAPPVAVNYTETFTFQAKEPKTVLAGTFATCRYRTDGANASTYDTTWYIVGKGIPALVESTVNGVVTDRQELKSGTYNGTPL